MAKTCDFHSTTSFKIVLIGDSNAGKTSIITRRKEGTFLGSLTRATIGESIDTTRVLRTHTRCAIIV